MDRGWYRSRDVGSVVMMWVGEVVMGNGPDVFMGDAALVSELVSVAIELGPIGGKHCTMRGAQYKC